MARIALEFIGPAHFDGVELQAGHVIVRDVHLPRREHHVGAVGRDCSVAQFAELLQSFLLPPAPVHTTERSCRCSRDSTANLRVLTVPFPFLPLLCRPIPSEAKIDSQPVGCVRFRINRSPCKKGSRLAVTQARKRNRNEAVIRFRWGGFLFVWNLGREREI